MSDITANVVIGMPSQLFTLARSFKAVANGSIYIGQIDTDPTIPSNQIQVYLENENGDHVPVPQPIVINAGGFPVYNGQVSKFVTVQGHSMAVYDAYGTQQFYYPNVLKYDPDQLRTELAGDGGAGLIGYDGSVTYPDGTVGAAIGPYAATGATKKYSREDRANRQLYAEDYGDPVTDIGDSANKGLDYLFGYATEAEAHGGTLHVTRGRHNVQTQILMDRTAGGADQADNISIVGEGMGTSELRATAGLSAGSSIIKTNEPTGKFIQLMTIRDITTRGGYNGIRVETASRTNIKNVKIEGASNSGLYVSNSWVNDYSQILAASNGLHGVEFEPVKQKTSTVVTAGYSLSNSASGWRWGFMTYCVANGVASDKNAHHGHLIQNSNGFVMNAPGAESNGRSGIYVEASAALGKNKSIVIQGAFMHANNTANTGFANLLHLKSSDSTENHVTIRDSTSSSPAVNGPNDIIVDGVGAIATVDNCVMPNRWSTTNGGYVDWVHHTLLINSVVYGAGAARIICQLRSTQGYLTTYGGMLIVHAGNLNPSNGSRRTATYVLLVNKTLSGTSVVSVMSSAGETTGATNSSPSFTWTINGNDQLVAATSTATIAGTFWFEISTSGQVVVQEVA